MIADAANLGVELSAAQATQMSAYGDMVVKWNRTMNLVSRQDIDRFYQRHILDSLSGVPLLRGGQLMDVGSGAGLPGVPLAIACPTMAVTLNERMAKRCRFLHQVVTQLQLGNVAIAESDVGAVAGLFDTVTARAVDDAQAIWQKVKDKLTPNGQLLVYLSTGHTDAGADPDSEEESAPVTPLQITGAAATYQEVAVPGLSGRHILCQIAAT